MKKQRGAALIVVLSLLTMSLMLGLSGMQSSLVDERLAGNYKAQTEAQMAAEQAATEGWLQSSSAVFDDSVSLSDILVMNWEDFVGGDQFSEVSSEDVCAGRLECRYRYIEDGSRYVASMGRVIVGDIGVAESELILVRLVTLTIPNINGAHTCYGEDCSYDSGGNSELTGIDHPVPSNSSCNGGACRTDPDEDEENRNDVAQCFYPDTSESGSFGHCKPGEEALNNDSGADGWVDFLAALGSGVAYSGDQNDTVGSLGSRASPAFIDVVSGTVSRGTGNVNTIGIIVVRSGATFEMSGTGHHEGLVIVEEGANLVYNGTPVLYGSIISLNGSIDFDLNITGNTRVRYSEEAVGMLRNSFENGSSGFSIGSWR